MKTPVDSQVIDLIDNMSICIFHNGNSQVLNFYKNKFLDLTFSGNLAEASNLSDSNCLWEICFADATAENLMAASTAGVYIIRHISTYNNDLTNLLPECELFNYDDWLTFVVIKNISFADEIISDIAVQETNSDETAIITTGRTANMHLQNVLSKFNIKSFENEKIVYPRVLDAKSSIFMWRENQWECLTSIWIAKNTKFMHNTSNQPELNLTVKAIDYTWITNDWFNMAQFALDYAVFFKTVLKRSTTIMTTEQAILNYTSVHKKLNYTKHNVIDQYDQTKQVYESSEVVKILNLLYNKVQKQLPLWTKPV